MVLWTSVLHCKVGLFYPVIKEEKMRNSKIQFQTHTAIPPYTSTQFWGLDFNVKFLFMFMTSSAPPDPPHDSQHKHTLPHRDLSVKSNLAFKVHLKQRQYIWEILRILLKWIFKWNLQHILLCTILWFPLMRLFGFITPGQSLCLFILFNVEVYVWCVFAA